MKAGFGEHALRLGAHALVLRPMLPDDRDAVLDFARALPAHDLLHLRRDITREDVLDVWVAQLERHELQTLLALEGDRVVGYATVHREPLPWTAHVAELRTLVAPALRGLGLGRLLTQQAFALALGMGIEKLVVQMTLDQKAAIATAEGLGFRSEALLRDHVKDREGRRHDLLILSHDVTRHEGQLAALGLAGFEADPET